MALFPMFPVSEGMKRTTVADLPLCREVAWDFKADRAILRRGEPVVVEGAEAVKVWIYHALKTVRGRYGIYSRDYGNEAEGLIGQPYSEAVKRAEAIRYIREAIAPNPYVTDVTEVSVDFAEATITISVRVQTVYGEVALVA